MNIAIYYLKQRLQSKWTMFNLKRSQEYAIELSEQRLTVYC
jgi:hypothetical protein